MESIENQEAVKGSQPLIKIPEVHALPEASTFDEANLDPDLLEAVGKQGWKTPTPVQGLCLPYTSLGKDVAGFAQTGTGKTGVFLLTIANKVILRRKKQQETEGPSIDAVILAPTRELALQISHDAETLLKGLKISVLAVFGGVDYDKQAQSLKEGVNIVVATPGRLKDYLQKKIFSLKDCKQFVCDEADRMFDMGFIEDVEFFLDKLPEDTQKLLFSATTNEQVKELAFEYLENPEYISVNPEVITPENITQKLVTCESKYKLPVLLGLLQQEKPACSIIFTNTKIVADWLHYKLTRNGLEADLITGDLQQKKRIALIKKIKKGEIKSLIATDVASRGLHIAGVTHVFNFDLPDEAANYVHRIGRTARAGAKGSAYSLVCEDYGHNFEGIQTVLGDAMKLKSQWFDPEFLKIEDKAGNPWEDPEFKSKALPKPRERDRSRDRKPMSGKGRGERAPRREKTDDPRRKDRTNDQRRRKAPLKKHGHKGDEGRYSQKRPHKKHDKYRDQSRNRHAQSQLPATQSSQPRPTSTFEIIKRFFRAIFRRK